jgi:hypothetical protein
MRKYYLKAVSERRGLLIELPFAADKSICESCKGTQSCHDLLIATLLKYILVKCDRKAFLFRPSLKNL